jgi:UDP-N-acetylglucosamine--N-acetylmuramyl-(pentapeptide) pyrophosphoryl-undecaprenol N-acetylglucosamine transferase
LERELVPAAGYELDLANLRGLERKLSWQSILFLWSLFKGSIDCRRILRHRQPDVVVGGGGYVSWAPVFVASLSRVPTLIMELDSHMGLANRVLAPLSRRVALSFPIAGRDSDKYFISGRPMGRGILDADAATGRQSFSLTEDAPVVLVYGGSLGARSINLACAEAFGHGRLDFQLVHISGRRDYQMMQDTLQKQGYDHENYHLLDYTGKLPHATAAADLVVARSGASILELAALGKPALLVPYPYATADHQRKNAEWMVAAGAAEMIIDSELTSAVIKEKISSLLADQGHLEQMAAASRELGSSDGAARVAEEIGRMAGTR